MARRPETVDEERARFDRQWSEYMHGHGVITPEGAPQSYSVSRADVQADRGRGVEYITRGQLAAYLWSIRHATGYTLELNMNDIYLTDHFTFDQEAAS